ncbi:hypothetical protein COOONC_03894 [Cooperia oncophora]
MDAEAHNYSTVDILIGIDNYWDVVEFNSNRQLPCGLVESKNKTWTGTVCSAPASSRTSSVCKGKSDHDHQSVSDMDHLVQRLFGLESFETGDETDDINKSIIQQYYDTVQIKNVRHNPKIWAEYCKTFEQQIQSGIIEEVDEALSSREMGILHSSSSCVQRG